MKKVQPKRAVVEPSSARTDRDRTMIVIGILLIVFFVTAILVSIFWSPGSQPPQASGISLPPRIAQTAVLTNEPTLQPADFQRGNGFEIGPGPRASPGQPVSFRQPIPKEKNSADGLIGFIRAVS